MLTGHQRIALLRAGITAEDWDDSRLLLKNDDAGLWVDVKDDGLHDHHSGYGSTSDVDRLRSAIREIVELKHWTPPPC